MNNQKPQTKDEGLNGKKTAAPVQRFVHPYFEHDGITIYHGDARSIFPRLGLDAVLTDPPYGISHKHSGGGNAGPKNPNSRRNSDRVTGDAEPFDPAWLFQYRELLLFGATHYHHALPSGGRWIAWDKLCDREPWDSFSDVEFAWMNRDGKDLMVSYTWKGLIWEGSKNGKAIPRRVHPTQKPVSVMAWCLDLFDAETVCDPYMGSGTTLVAAKLAGRRAVGIEIEERYCEIAANRLLQGVLPFVG